MSSKSSTSRYSETLDLSSIDSIKLISEYQNKYEKLNKLHLPVMDQYLDKNILELNKVTSPFADISHSIKKLGNQNNINSQNIRIHSYYQKLTDDFLGKHKFNCFSPVIHKVNEVQKAFTQLLEGNPEPLAKLDLTKIASETEELATKCDIIYQIKTPMDSNITDALNKTFDSSNPFETALCAGNCLSSESDNV
ncbi:MAG: hypothetical protein WBJ81_01815 [Rickettsiales bacterium]